MSATVQSPKGSGEKISPPDTLHGGRSALLHLDCLLDTVFMVSLPSLTTSEGFPNFILCPGHVISGQSSILSCVCRWIETSFA